MCQALSVSRSGYYAWLHRGRSARARANSRLLVEIRAIHEALKGLYGSPRMHRELVDRGYRCGRHRVAHLMRTHGISARPKRRFRPQTTDSHHGFAVAPNLLCQRFHVDKPNRVWVADITYIATEEGWLYLAAVLDLFARRVVGWSSGPDLSRELPLRALDQALRHRHPAAGLIHHSDRGTQYASDDYQERLAREGLVASMSRTGNCYDNAAMESFFASLKNERVHRVRYPSRWAATRDLTDYIEVFYNRIRRHSTLDYLSPAMFELKHKNVA